MVNVLAASWPSLLSGLWTTIWLSLVGLSLGSAAGFILGIVRALRLAAVLGPVIDLYVHLIRGTPFLVQLYIVYFVLPRTGLPLSNLSAETAAILALAFYTASYATEITRRSLENVPRNQIEAAQAVGLTQTQRLWLIVMPQALRLMLPPLGGLYVVVVKSTAIVSVVGISELVRAGENVALRQPGHVLPAYLCVALLYFVFCYPLLRLVRSAERRVSRLAIG